MWDYNTCLRLKRCNRCNNYFVATSKKIVCNSCKSKYFYANRVLTKVICVRCKKVLSTKEKRNTKNVVLIRTITCNSCRYICKQKPLYGTIIQKHICKQCGCLIRSMTKKKRHNTLTVVLKTCKKCISLNMRNNNPMKCPLVAAKMSRSLKETYNKGLINYNKTISGSRGFNFDCRSRLYKPFILKILTRDNFKCSNCGSKIRLHVHHKYPLRNIIKEVLYESGLDKVPKDIKTYNSLLVKVVKKHKLEYGITLCKVCHEKEDYYYRPFKGVSK